MVDSIFVAIIYFTILSILGYLYETIFCLIKDLKFENRGFLFGPVIPIYGFGALFGTLFFEHLHFNVIGFFIFSVLFSIILEYCTHFALEKLFHAYWWDYSKLPLNINGRVCLIFSLCFGIAGLLIVYKINPIVFTFINKMNTNFIEISSLVIVALFSADVSFTVAVITNFEDKISSFGEEFTETVDNLLKPIKEERDEIQEKISSFRPQLYLMKLVSWFNISGIKRIQGFKNKSLKNTNIISLFDEARNELIDKKNIK